MCVCVYSIVIFVLKENLFQTNNLTMVDKFVPSGMKDCDSDVEYVLIGAGLPRTGTMSTCLALEKLLPGKCHHMVRAFTGPNDPPFWTKASRGELSEGDWREFLRSERISASVDFPMSLYWKDLVKMYPNAKVLLNVRDPVKWYNSVRNTIAQVLEFLTKSWMSLPLRCVMALKGSNGVVAATYTCTGPTYLGPNYPGGMFGAVEAGEETAVKFFNEWVESVKSEIPEERLLVFEVKNGWQPLCEFLQVPVPDEPFPNANDTAEQQAKLRAMKKFCIFSWTVIAAGLGTAFYYLKDAIPKPRLVFD